MKILCKNKYWKLNKDYNIDKILYFLIDRPSRIGSYNEYSWKNKKGQFHRNYDFPSIVWNNGDVQWHKNNKIHKENNKPAIIYAIGNKHYYVNGNFVKEKLYKT